MSQPATPGFSPLPGTNDEARRLGHIFDVSQMQCDILDDRQATASAVRYAIGQHPWLYLACHGHQDLGDATRSAFGLYDGPLALSDLMATMFDNAELAFLSACYTAVGDEKTPEVGRRNL